MHFLGVFRMRFSVRNLGILVGALLASSAAMASDGAATEANGLVALGSALAMGVAALGGTLGQGRVAATALEGIARNPGSRDAVFTPMLIALALIEFQAIMGFIIAFMWFGK